MPIIEEKNKRVKEPEAFAMYFKLGLGRSLERLRRHYIRSTSRKTPSIDTLKYWSKKFHWQEKIDELDKEVQQEALKITKKEMSNTKAELVDICAIVIESFRKDIEKKKFNPTMSDVARAHKIIREELGKDAGKQNGGLSFLELHEAVRKEEEREREEGRESTF